MALHGPSSAHERTLGREVVLNAGHCLLQDRRWDFYRRHCHRGSDELDVRDGCEYDPDGLPNLLLGSAYKTQNAPVRYAVHMPQLLTEIRLSLRGKTENLTDALPWW